MWNRLKEIEKSYEELTKRLSQPEILNNKTELARVAKNHAELEKIVFKFQELKRLKKEKEELEKLLKESTDEELKNLAREELETLSPLQSNIEQELELLLFSPEPEEEKDVLLEIRAGTGGEEASLFASDLFRMYSRFAEQQGWKTEILSSNTTGLGGFKEIIMSVKGKGAYNKLKFESGIHRVQRIPVTESGGRIHTSAATVAVLPEVEEVELKIKEDDLKIETFRASGAGGQYVNKTSSAVRITHLPSGIVVSCQDERSQYQNKEKALRLLRAHLYQQQQQELMEAVAKERKSQVKSGDRSEKIRTYNFPQDRITDHRINLTIHNLQDILDGHLDVIITALQNKEREEKLKHRICK